MGGIHPVFGAVLLLKRTQSQHKISSWRLGSWDPTAKAHMMAYDKQLGDFSTALDEEPIL